jgi:hypothetical protein
VIQIIALIHMITENLGRPASLTIGRPEIRSVPMGSGGR